MNLKFAKSSNKGCDCLNASIVVLAFFFLTGKSVLMNFNKGAVNADFTCIGYFAYLIKIFSKMPSSDQREKHC